jgi:hypothetical protein
VPGTGVEGAVPTGVETFLGAGREGAGRGRISLARGRRLEGFVGELGSLDSEMESVESFEEGTLKGFEAESLTGVEYASLDVLRWILRVPFASLSNVWVGVCFLGLSGS